MKKFLTILIILLACSSLKSQEFYDFSWPYNKYESIDTIVFDLSVKYITVEKKSSQWSDLKARIKEIPHLKVKIVSMAIIGTWMYCFKDDIQAWSRKHDKASHLFLSYGLSKYFGWKFALGFMLSIEATQSDIFGTEGRYEDTIEDLFVDFVGIGFSLKF